MTKTHDFQFDAKRGWSSGGSDHGQPFTNGWCAICGKEGTTWPTKKWQHGRPYSIADEGRGER